MSGPQIDEGEEFKSDGENKNGLYPSLDNQLMETADGKNLLML